MSATPDSVKELLDSEDFGDRIRGLNQLRTLDPAIAFDLIKPAVNDSHPRVRYAAVSQIASLGNQNPAEVLPMLRDRLIHDSEVDVQAAAADAIGALKLTEAYQDLESLYQSTSEWLLQFSIIAALGELGDPRAFDLLEQALHSDIELVRTAAIGALGELGDERALPLLLSYISSDDWQVRHRVVQALSHFQHPDAQNALGTLAQDDVEMIATEAKMYLQDAS